jgi:membrane protease YdiL (CAAX protease family)
MDKETREILKKYVKDCLNRGYHKKEIIDYIEKRGFDRDEIEDMLHLMHHKDHHQFFIKLLLLLVPFVILSLAHFIFDISIPAMVFIIALAFALLAILAIDKDGKRMLFLILGAFFVAEITLIKYNIEIGLVLYSVFLAFLVLSLIFRKFRLEVKEALFITGIIPLMRLLGALLPLEKLSFLSRIVGVYSILIIVTFIIFKNLNLKKISSKDYIGFLPLAIILGLVFGWIEFQILRPAPVFGSLNILTVLLGLGIMGLTGLAEEFIFRGLMQNHFLRIFNIATTILLTNLIFVFMHLIWLNYLELIFVFAVGSLCGIIYYHTKNLVLVSFLHGMINFSLFVLSPILIR